jgi:hypothetical protein
MESRAAFGVGVSAVAFAVSGFLRAQEADAPRPPAPPAEVQETTAALDATPGMGRAALLSTAATGRVVLAAKIGIQVLASGTETTEYGCEYVISNLCDETPEYSEKDRSLFTFGADVLVHFAPHLRLGLGAYVVPSTKLEYEGRSYKYGTEVSFPAIIEPFWGLSPNTALAVRLQAGPMALFPGGDLQDAIDSAEVSCAAAIKQNMNCSVDHGPFLGFTLGVGGGVLLGNETVRVRLDALLQYVSFPTGSAILGLDYAGISTSDSYAGTRFGFTVGGEVL